jgi:hypothetical protein
VLQSLEAPEFIDADFCGVLFSAPPFERTDSV